MNERTVNYKDSIITTIESEEKAIFFRSPLQKGFFDAYITDAKLSAWKYMNDISNPIRKFYEILIGNGLIVRKIDKWAQDIDWGGFLGNMILSPIYFKRNYRKLTAYSYNNEYIRSITSYGYADTFSSCAGECHIEKTVICLSNGKRIKIKRTGSYYFTYEHVAKKIFDTGIIENKY